MRWRGRLPYKCRCSVGYSRGLLTTGHRSRPTPSHDYVFLAGSAIRAADTGAKSRIRLRFGAGAGAGHRSEFRHLHGGQLRTAAAAALPKARATGGGARAQSKAGFPQFSLSPGNYLGFRDQNHTFSGIAAFGGAGFNLAGGGEPERLRGTRVTLDFFDVLGRKPRWAAHSPRRKCNSGQNRVAILSYGLWQRRFAGNRDALGQTLKLNDELYTVIGVMPADFSSPRAPKSGRRSR